MTDTIADMLTRVRNASLVKKAEVCVPYSKIKLNIANILVNNSYLAKAELKKEKHPYILLGLRYNSGQPAIQHIKRISKPGRRYYIKKGVKPPAIVDYIYSAGGFLLWLIIVWVICS